MTLEQLLTAIRAKGWCGSGIALAGSYMATALSCIQSQEPASVKAAIKANQDKLVYRDPHGVVTSLTQKATGGKVQTLGTADRKQPGLDAKSVMEFECILTTAKEDRDGDILMPRGARVDAKMPLLWQHLPMEPLGKLFSVVSQDDEAVKTHFGIADTKMGQDAAILVEYGALRISHGFKPLKFEPIKDKSTEEEFDGWKVFEYEVMEGSLVSIPANTGAVITAFSRNKLHSPLIKSWAEDLYRDRPVLVGAFSGRKTRKAKGVVVNVNLGGKGFAPQVDTQSSAKQTHACEVHGCNHVSHQTPAAKSVVEYQCPTCGGKAYNGDPQTGIQFRGSGLCSECGTKFSIVGLGLKPVGKAADDEDEDEEVPEPSDTDLESGGDELSAPLQLSELASKLEEMQGMDQLSGEASARLGVVAGIMAEVSGGVSAAMERVGEAGKTMDVGGVATAVNEMVGQCAAKLERAVDEMGRISELEDLPDGAAEQLGSLKDAMAGILGGLYAGNKTGNPEDNDDGYGVNDEGDEEVLDEGNAEGNAEGTPLFDCADCGAEFHPSDSNDGGVVVCPECGSAEVGAVEDGEKAPGDHAAVECGECGNIYTGAADGGNTCPGCGATENQTEGRNLGKDEELDEDEEKTLEDDSLSGGDEVVPMDGDEPEDEVKCASCGKGAQSDMMFCGYCGVPLPVKDEETQGMPGDDPVADEESQKGQARIEYDRNGDCWVVNPDGERTGPFSEDTAQRLADNWNRLTGEKDGKDAESDDPEIAGENPGAVVIPDEENPEVNAQ